jgi:CBS domain-containing protein
MILKTMMREHLEVFTATLNSRISEVANTMREKRVGSIVVVDDADLVIGIITDRDIAMALALGAATADSFINEVMSKDVETISESMTLFDVARYFRTVEVKRLPVVDKKKRLIGIVSSDDVIAFLAREMFDTCNSLEPKLGHMV